jgi:hypothetical protein
MGACYDFCIQAAGTHREVAGIHGRQEGETTDGEVCDTVFSFAPILLLLSGLFDVN